MRFSRPRTGTILIALFIALGGTAFAARAARAPAVASALSAASPGGMVGAGWTAAGANSYSAALGAYAGVHTQGCATKTPEQAVGSVPQGIAIDHATHSVYVSNSLGPGYLSIFNTSP